jgi:thioredoxin reductase (NADPH)
MITPDNLRAVPLFMSLDDADLNAIAVAAADMQLVAGEWLVHEGEMPAFFALLSGELEVSKTVGGAEQVINHYHPGDTFGEVPLLLGSTVVANLRAITVARVARLDAEEFHALLARSEGVAAGITRTMAKRVAHLQQISVETATPTALIVGYRADLECHEVREFFLQHHRVFRWLEPSEAATAPHVPTALRDGPYPAIMLADGTVLRCPSTRELADRLGLQTAPRQTAYDVIVVGGGPAGLAAAVYGASEGLTTLMVERAAPGGQAGTSSRIENYLGFPTGLSGDDLGARSAAGDALRCRDCSHAHCDGHSARREHARGRT